MELIRKLEKIIFGEEECVFTECDDLFNVTGEVSKYVEHLRGKHGVDQLTAIAVLDLLGGGGAISFYPMEAQKQAYKICVNGGR